MVKLEVEISNFLDCPLRDGHCCQVTGARFGCIRPKEGDWPKKCPLVKYDAVCVMRALLTAQKGDTQPITNNQ